MNKDEFLIWSIEQQRTLRGHLKDNQLVAQLIILRRLGEITDEDFRRFFTAEGENEPKADS